MIDSPQKPDDSSRSLDRGVPADFLPSSSIPFLSLAAAWKRSLLVKIIIVFLGGILLSYCVGALVGWLMFVDAAKEQWRNQARINTQIASATLRTIYTYIVIDTDESGQVQRVVTSQPIGDDDSILYTGFAPADVLALVTTQTKNETWLLRYDRATAAIVDVAGSMGGPGQTPVAAADEAPIAEGLNGRFATGFAVIGGERHYVGLLPVVSPDGVVLNLVAVSIGKAAILHRAQDELFRNSLLTLLAVLLVTGIVATIMARHLFRPVPALVEATLQIASEVTDKITPFQSRADEIGDMARAIEALREAVVERARLREIRDMAVTLEHMAHHDALTGLANRILLMKTINASLGGIGGSESFNVLLLDLDRFKVVNDTLGHASGDLLLTTVANRITDVLGPGDLAARLGGDEFAVVQCVERDSDREAHQLAGRLLETISSPFMLEGNEVVIGTSIGIACAPVHGSTASQLLQNADLALYRAKAAGRGTMVVFEQGMDMVVQDQHALEMDLRFALQRREFELHYQPFVGVVDREIRGFEALVRWRHPQLGLIPPDRFIPLAEETGIIIQLGEWVLMRSAQDAVSWPKHIKLAVNLSPVQLRSESIVETVMGVLQTSGLPASRLELEVTESVMLAGEASRSRLEKLRSIGIAIVLDDFGTGYASLSYLAQMPFSKIKIDRGFVTNLPTLPTSRAIVAAIINLARELDMDVTAEGVETEEQLLILQAAACSDAQGYLFARPKPIEDVERVWEDRVTGGGLSRAV
ncbi:Diguanylate cyclase/phosphodiesterase with extracellular sensor [Neorhizobium galegae bv. officinalis]|uniref:Diguanylate cyclase/phosphodiesterase with extracellular sensor n=1 Tax=Neorhizobium galegae bv. officinalis TaxID=323656 RepID=A0A0T7FBA6_NEOGA|nr:EAL domain-containing protein [Neorhizobium galegae]CDZ32327.1 Diguanylate cyclase/phosphodiesterase with extracellular sensor [Neorhizobium galegae bv. officinalis]